MSRVLTSRKNAWEKTSISLRYYANCVSTTLTVLILHNVESVHFFYSNPVFQCTLVTCQNPSLPWCCRSRRWLAHSAPPRWPGGEQTYTRCRVACICSSGTPGTPPAGASVNPSHSASCSCWPWPYWCQLSPPFGVRGNSEGWGSQEGAYYSLGLRETEWRKMMRRCSRIKY